MRNFKSEEEDSCSQPEWTLQRAGDMELARNIHLYLCALMGISSGPLIASMLLSLLNHVIDKHDGP